MKHTVFILCISVLALAGCSSSPSTNGVMTVNGVTYDDQNWNGR